MDVVTGRRSCFCGEIELSFRALEKSWYCAEEDGSCRFASHIADPKYKKSCPKKARAIVDRSEVIQSHAESSLPDHPAPVELLPTTDQAQNDFHVVFHEPSSSNQDLQFAVSEQP